MSEVKLTKSECSIAAQVGAARHIEAMFKGLRNNVEGLGWNEHIEGAAAEMAFSKIFGLYWDGSVNTFKKPDVEGFQIRSTPLSNGRLIVRPRDSDKEVFVLMKGKIPEFICVGAILGGQAKKPEFLYNPNGGSPAWFVYGSQLHPVEEYLK